MNISLTRQDKEVLAKKLLTMQSIHNTILNGKEYVISTQVRPCGKIGYYVHELGVLTQFAKVMGTGERKHTGLTA